MSGTFFIARQYEEIQCDAIFLVYKWEKTFADKQSE